MHKILVKSLLIALFLFDLLVFALARGFFWASTVWIRLFWDFHAVSMPKVFDFGDVGDFCPGGLLYPNPKRSIQFPSHESNVDLYLAPRKRFRIYAPFLVSKKQPSIDVLPDECLFEIFRRLSTDQERSACAGVSKHWLMLLSNIRSEELCNTTKTTQSVELKIKTEEDASSKLTEKIEFGDANGIKSEDEDFQEKESHGSLSRSLEGKKATDVKLAAIAVGTSSRGGLGKLSIRQNDSTRGLTNFGLKAISRNCPSLRVLSLWNVVSIGDEGLCEIASGIRSLKKFDLCHCPAVTDKSLVAIAMNSPNLVSVTIESCSEIGNESLKALGSYCPNLRSVAVKNCPLIGDQGVASLLSSSGHVLTKAKFQGLNISDVSLAVIGHYGKAMTDLALINLQKVKERGFWVMGKGQGLKNLKSLSITACGGVSDLGLESLGKGCPDLKTFGLKKCPVVSDIGVASFAKASALLESLQLEECHRITQNGIFGILANCGKKLKALALVNCLGIRNFEFGFPLTFLCDSLRSLTIQNCPGFGDNGLTLLGQLCPKLTHVNLTAGLQGITDSGLLPLIHSSDSRLEKVNLTRCVNLTDNVVCTIASLHGETLEILNLDGCRYITDTSLTEIAQNCLALSELHVSQSCVTDSGISVLAGAKKVNLQVLSVEGCSLVSDKSVPFLKVLGRTLVGLNVQNCRGITSGTVDMLLEKLWRCDVLY